MPWESQSCKFFFRRNGENTSRDTVRNSVRFTAFISHVHELSERSHNKETTKTTACPCTLHVCVVHGGLTSKFDIHISIQQEIFSLEVAVNNVVPVAVVHCCQNLPKLFACLIFTHTALWGQVVCREKIFQCRSTFQTEVIHYFRMFYLGLGRINWFT